MKLSALTAISPVDGRYRRTTANLAPYFSEFALIKYRLKVEVEYFIALCEWPLPELSSFGIDQFKDKLRNIYINFDLAQAEEIKEIETEINHDVKAVEYYLKKAMINLGLGEYVEFIHFGLTSQDINNTAIPSMMRDALKDIYIPNLTSVINIMNEQAALWNDIPMLARTHGQPASPTRLGKEWKVYIERLNNQIDSLIHIPYSAKFGGATGNFNAHYIAYPEIDWVAFADQFVNKNLRLNRNRYTTQIDHYDNIGAWLDNIKRIHTILIDLCQDIWIYISMEYFGQKISQGEVGSSAMPHKVNPIDFENAEGNLGMSIATAEYMSRKLPVSRLQRDLTDSTILRNIGMPLSHGLIAIKSLEKGLNKLVLNQSVIEKDLADHAVVIAEAIQTLLRRYRFPEPYETLKKLTRKNEKLTLEDIYKFIDGLEISVELRERLKQITPQNYTGVKIKSD